MSLCGAWALQLGEPVFGTAYEINNTWVEFNGQVPHAVKPLDGTRMTCVLFTRNKWLDTPEEVEHQDRGNTAREGEKPQKGDKATLLRQRPPKNQVRRRHGDGDVGVV